LERFVPEAWAAFKKDYNNGKDGSGRVVTNPAGIDLCLTVAKSLGFAANASHWVYVDMSDFKYFLSKCCLPCVGSSRYQNNHSITPPSN